MKNNNWFRTPYKLFEDERLTATDIFILSMLIDFAKVSENNTTYIVTITQQKIIDILHLSRMQVYRSITNLENTGYIFTKERTKYNTTYFIPIENTIEPKLRDQKPNINY